MQGAVSRATNSQSVNVRGYSRADSLGGESTKSARSTASSRSRRDEGPCCEQETLTYFLKRAGILVVSISIGVIYTTQRFNWPVEYAFYWAMVTALTVGYGDSPVCQADVAAAAAAAAGGGGNASTRAGGSCSGGSLCDYGNIYDTDEDMIFIMLYCTWMVIVALSLLTEFLESLEAKQRARETKAQFKLLEAYFNGDSLEVAKERAINEDGDTDDEDGDDWVDASADAEHSSWSWWYCCLTKYVRRKLSKEAREILKSTFWHVVLVFIGIIAYAYYYNKGAVRSAYWVVITSLAVGYGDTTPTDPLGYGIGFFYITVLVVSNIQLLMQYVQLFRGQAKVAEVLSMTFDPEVFKEFNKNGDGEITQAEYLTGTLVLLGKVDRQTLDLINKQFACLDLDGGGTITIDELDPEAQKQARLTRRLNSVAKMNTSLNSIMGTSKAANAFKSLRKPSVGSISAIAEQPTPFGNKTFRENLADGFKAAQADVAAAAAAAEVDADADADADAGMQAETQFDGFEGVRFSSTNDNLPEMTVDENGQAGLVF